MIYIEKWPIILQFEALAAAKAADVVVLGLGIVQKIESESHDRTEVDLPTIQHELAAAIFALHKPTAIFLLHGGMVGLSAEMESAAAIVDMGYPGFQGGHALASVLFGDYNPGGKLPYTLYDADYVTKSEHTTNQRILSASLPLCLSASLTHAWLHDTVSMEDMDFSTAPGRSYKFYTGKPVLPFGWGLSYTTFKISPPADQFEHAEFGVSESAWSQEYAVTVTNTGSVAGDEVVQVRHS